MSVTTLRTSQITTSKNYSIVSDTSSTFFPLKSISSGAPLTESIKNPKDLHSNLGYFKTNYENIPITCFYCDITFENIMRLECHQLLYRHVGPVKTKFFKYKEWVECRKCQMKLSFKDENPFHKCHLKLEEELYTLYKNLNHQGIPLYCILCETKPTFSRSELIIHLICFHSDNMHSNCCSICLCPFKTANVHTKVEHMRNEHMGEMEINFVKLKTPYDGKLISVASYSNPMICVYKIDKMKICGEKFSNLARFTLHILCNHCIKSQNDNRSGSKIVKHDSERINCNRCDLVFNNASDLNVHIIEYHQVIYEMHLQYLIANNGFLFKYNPLRVCVLCMRSFKSKLSKEVHMYVTHWSKSWPECGLCSCNIIVGDCKDLSDNLQYKYLKTHEKFHTEAIFNFLHLKETDSELIKDFNLLLIAKAKLYVDTYIPIKITEQLELEKNLKKRIFPKEITNFFVQLGNKNRKVQEALELFG